MAMTARHGSRAREVLESRLEILRPAVSAGARPHGGWIRAIRESLGMPLEDFASRLNLTTSTASRMESSERDGRIQLATLERAAAALDCDLVVALVPRRPLDQMVLDRARRLATLEVGAVGHTMTLEGQGLTDSAADRLADELVADLMSRPGLWRQV